MIEKDKISILIAFKGQKKGLESADGRAQPDVTSGSGCPGILKCPDSGLPFFFLPGLRTFNTFKSQEKP